MNKKYLKAIALISVLGICIGFLHFLIIEKVNTFFTIFQIYSFNCIVTFVSVSIVFLINIKFKDKVGFTFMSLGVVKMIISVFFLMPLINSDFENKIPDTLNFFLCYFLFLTLESLITIRQLNKI